MKENSPSSNGKLSTEEKLQNAINELSLQNEVMDKRAKELIIANQERIFESAEKEKRADELVIANKELIFQKEEKHKRAEELIIANKELAFQNEEKEKRAAELIIANKELVTQNEEKEKRAAELEIANKELAFQNEEKHKRAEELLIANKELALLNTKQQTLFASIVNSSDDAMLSKTVDGIITSWNHGAEKIFGYGADEIIGKHIFMLMPAEFQNEEIEIIKKIRNGETVAHYETVRVRKDGSVFNVSLTISPIRSVEGNITGASKILRDISERKKAEEKLINANRMYAFISGINKMIVRVEDEASLFNEACRLAIDIGKFKMAWIGKLDEKTNILIPAMHCGGEHDHLTKIKPISIDDIPENRGPTGTALREGRYIICNDIANCLEMVPWKEDSAALGYLSSMTLPLKIFGKVVGSYSLYATSKNFFDDVEIAMAEEVAGDMSFALENFEKAALHKKAEEKIKESEEVFHKLFDESADATLILDETGFTNCNESAVSLLGYSTKKEVLNKQPWDISVERQPDEKLSKEKAKAMMAKALKDGCNRFEWIHTKADGSELPVEVMLTPIYLQGMRSFYVVWRDITERKKTEEKLTYSEERYRHIVETSQEGIWLIDEHNKTIFVNKRFTEIFGYTFKEMLGKSNFDLMDKDGKAIAKQKTVQRKQGISDNFEHIYFTKSGEKIWVDVSASPIKNDKGEYVGALAMMNDITKRKQTEAKLKASEKQFRAMIEKSADMITLAQPDGTMTYASPSITKILGYNLEEFFHLSGLDLIHPEDVAVMFHKVQDVLQTPGKSFYNQHRLKHKNGDWLWTEGTMTNMLHDPDIGALVSNFRDISERKKAEEEVIESEKEVRAIAESMPQIVWVLTADGKNIYFNHRWVEYTGLTLEQSYGDGWLIPFHKEDKQIVWNAWSNAVADRVEYSVECRLRKYDGSYHWWLLRGVPKINKKGEILKWYGTCTDIETIKEAEIRLVKSEIFNRSVLNSLSAHISVIDESGNIIAVNESWQRFAIDNGETVLQRTGVGSNYFNVCEKAVKSGDLIAAKALNGIRDVFNDKKTNFYLEYPCDSPDKKRWYGMNVRKFESHEAMAVVSHMNISERMMAEQNLEQQNKELKKTNTELDRFVYSTSHDLRAPLSSLLGIIAMVNDEIDPGNKLQIEHMEMMRQSVLKLDRFIEEILDYSRNARSDISREEIDFKKAVQEVRENLKYMEGT